METNRLLSQTLFQVLPDAVLTADHNGCIFQANPQTVRLFGYSQDELIGRPVDTLLPKRYAQTYTSYVQTRLSEARDGDVQSLITIHGLHADGHEIPIDVMVEPIEEDAAQRFLVVIRNISRRRKTEEALHLTEERFRLLVEGVQDYAIFMLDTDGNIVSWNSGAERIKGYRAEEILGKHFSTFYTQEDIDCDKAAHELAVAAQEGRFEDEGWRIRKDGSRLWANVIITPLRGEDGKLLGFSKITRDLTDRRRAEESLLLELSSIVVASMDIRRMLTAIASSISHLLPNDYATIALYDSNADRLRVQELPSQENQVPPREFTLPLAGSPAGWCYQNRQVLFLDQLDKSQFAPGSMDHLVRAGVKSGCWLPLNSHGNIIGTLLIGSRREAAITTADTAMLMQMARQIAAAIDGANVFRQLSEMSNRLREEKRYLEEELRTEYSFEEIVGESPSLKRVLKQVETLAPTDATALVLGDTGTGKELIARAIHHLSPRRDHTFVKLNCSAIPMGLLESELFGHEKGAFTGAIAQRIGRLELAHMGTLFLDEVGDLPLELQPKLLRALQEKEIERIGGKRTIKVDIRLIAATNRDLAKMVKEGQFRIDLYYRLKVFPILIPSLRQRREDIPLLVNYFVAKHARRMSKSISAIPPDVMTALSNWHWPGNVRELENFIERAVILSQGSTLHAPLAELEDPEDTQEADPTLETAEREHILRVLRAKRGVIGGPGGAAEELGLKRTTLNSKLKKLGISREQYL
ncbi:sigma 54-interacting transcriptional regulator [Acidipila rosea]|uniref:PAS domain S-box-containing protein n=1 Tax=Acidipila rosea TaxID=768535 RepID=A0A4V2PV26_9BACT|nr:sigma 54-interacting transcriptional regulator [Acidipila rosea]TCK72771.1 PAS domain S-box-containing protein [Acidipila rosea]